MAFITSPGARSVSCIVTSFQSSTPFCIMSDGGLGEAGVLGTQGCSVWGAQDVRLGPTVPLLTGDVPHGEHLPSGFSVINKNSPSRLSGRFVPMLGLQPDEVLFSRRGW